MPGKEKEMIRNTFMLVSKSEYQDRSLCSFPQWLCSPSTCPYETDYISDKVHPAHLLPQSRFAR